MPRKKNLSYRQLVVLNNLDKQERGYKISAHLETLPMDVVQRQLKRIEKERRTLKERLGIPHD